MTVPSNAPASEPDLFDVLELEEIDRDLYRSTLVFPDPYPLYGGQVAAQALLAAGRTVPADRLPHSLHGYFLRSGDAQRPTVFRVDRDRDGRSYSARRVVAVQGGEVVFSMSASFSVEEEGPDLVASPPPEVQPPDELSSYEVPRLFSMEGRLPEQPLDVARHWPTRFWARSRLSLPDDRLVHASVLTYLSDIGTGLSAFPQEGSSPGPSLDHALWFHRPVRLDDWVLMDLVPRSVARGRGWYTGEVLAADGTLAASFTQEALFRPGPNPFRKQVDTPAR
ncbi:MAG TPA: acyl-CoA thioesterase domain-containing protein [Actinomycetales bacterium]|nr:acyl-CoA thioesterase domain-containing protein [Actinomycetales bacterium]